MPTPVYQFEHALDVVKGLTLHKLDFVAPLASSVTLDPVYAGRVVHLNSDGAFELGAVDMQMPIFLIQSSNSPDVSNPGGTHYTAGLPNLKMSGNVATGGFELSSTEFPTGVTFAPGDLLHAPTEAEIVGSDKSAAGKLHKAKTWPGGSGALVYPKDNICGIVSQALSTDMNGQSVVKFWSTYTPGNSGVTVV